MTLRLQNPDGKFIKSATIVLLSACAPAPFWLSVATCYGHRSEGYKTVRGAKTGFGLAFMKGGKWKEEADAT